MTGEGIRAWAEHTHVHGVSEVVHSKRWIVRIMWLALIFLSVSAMTIQLMELFTNFWARRWEASVFEELPEGTVD